jgi:tripartite-type tricarboxylate transporter receptor subunit TctC
MPDVIAGRVDLMFDLLASTLPYISKKQLHALAVTAPKRSPAAPDLPTVAEAGVSEYSFVNWFGVFAPAGTPRPVVEKINAAIVRVVEAKDFKAILASKGAESSTGSPEDFAKFFRSEVSRWDRLARDTKLAGTQ